VQSADRLRFLGFAAEARNRTGEVPRLSRRIAAKQRSRAGVGQDVEVDVVRRVDERIVGRGGVSAQGGVRRIDDSRSPLRRRRRAGRRRVPVVHVRPARSLVAHNSAECPRAAVRLRLRVRIRPAERQRRGCGPGCDHHAEDESACHAAESISGRRAAQIAHHLRQRLAGRGLEPEIGAVVVGSRALVDDGEEAPRIQRLLRKARDGPDLERRADDEEQRRHAR